MSTTGCHPIQHRVPVIANERLAERTFRLRLADREIGRRILPGQFIMLRLPQRLDPLMARPFALYDTWLDERGVAGVDLVYLVVGKMTRLMSELRGGAEVELWGPLGHGFSMTPCRHLLMVAGGIGQTPFLALARSYLGRHQYGEATPPAGCAAAAAPPQITMHYGVRSASFLAGVSDFERVGVQVAVATDDGTAGHHGFVTDLTRGLFESPIRPDRVVGCGPMPMVANLARITQAEQVPCELSLETPMACGVGICFSCVARIRPDSDAWDYRRVCVDGPVFDARQVVF
jgi:dihydroorotate dehydrogenase electron transfer subunit